jgi:hypothetical protein
MSGDITHEEHASGHQGPPSNESVTLPLSPFCCIRPPPPTTSAESETTTTLRSGAGIWQSFQVPARPLLNQATPPASASESSQDAVLAVTQELKAMNIHLAQQTRIMVQQQQMQTQLWETQTVQQEHQRREQKMQRLRWATEDVWSQTFSETFTCRGFSMEFHHSLIVDVLRAFRLDMGAPIPGRIYLYPSRNAEGIPMGAQGNEIIREGLCRAVQYLTGIPPQINQEASGYVMHYES